MGTICSRPRTKHDTPQVNASARPSRLSESDYKSANSSLNGNYKPEHDGILVQRQPSAETSELDVVVQHLHQNNQSVTGSAPELLQQWDHDHGVLVRSIDATIQVHTHCAPCKPYTEPQHQISLPAVGDKLCNQLPDTRLHEYAACRQLTIITDLAVNMAMRGPSMLFMFTQRLLDRLAT